jgi:hypothetical protein
MRFRHVKSNETTYTIRDWRQVKFSGIGVCKNVRIESFDDAPVDVDDEVAQVGDKAGETLPGACNLLAWMLESIEEELQRLKRRQDDVEVEERMIFDGRQHIYGQSKLP